MKLKLDPHQIETVEYCSKNKYSIMALEMGLGKTAVGLALWEKVGGTCLIICPSYLTLNWLLEIRKCFGDSPIVTLIKKGAEIYEVFDSDFVIVSYDLAQKAEQFFEWADMVLIDEGQELKSMKAKRTEYIHRVVYENSIKRLHILTGTPIKNRVEEYYSLLALCNYDPRIKHSDFLKRFPDSVTFADYFSHRVEFKMEINNRWVTIVKWEGVQRKDELRSYLKGHYIRFASKDVLKLREPRMKDILISNTPDKQLLAEFERGFAEEGADSVGPTGKALAALKKVPFTKKYVESMLEQVDCVPIYTDQVDSAKALGQAFGVEAITGQMPSQKRAKLGHAFQRGEMKVLVATIKSFSTGVDLTRANNLVVNDPPWVPGDLQQTIFRIHRRSQTKPCTIHRMMGSPQDKYIYEKLQDKSETIQQVI